MRSRSILYHVLVPLLAREPSIRLVREGVDQIVSAENGRLVTLESGRLVIRDLETTLHGDEVRLTREEETYRALTRFSHRPLSEPTTSSLSVSALQCRMCLYSPVSTLTGSR